MGGGISVISDNEHEMILKYSKDANIDDIIDLIKNKKIMYDSNNMITYTANDTIVDDDNGINNVVTCSSNGDNDGHDDTSADDNTTAPVVVPSLKLVKSSASIIDQNPIKAESDGSKLNTSASEGILSSSGKQLPSASSATGRTTALRRPSSKSAHRGPLLTVASPRSSASSKGVKSPSVLTSPVARRGKYGRRKSFSDDSDMNCMRANISPALSESSTGNIHLAKQSIYSLSNLSLLIMQETTSCSTISSQPTADSWDSVTEQPFCNTCSMAFKSFPILDRHIKYSDIHSANVKKLEMAVNCNTTVVNTKANIDENRGKMVEGRDYKLLYYGSKFFWKCKETVDVYIYHQILPNCLEIIVFDLQRNKELQRIYLDYTLLLDIIRPDVIVAVDSERSTKASSDRFAVLEDRDTMIDRESRHASIRYVINRLSYSLAKGTLVVTPEIKFLLLPTELDSSMQTPLLSEKPESLVSIPVNFRRRSNSDDIEVAINALDESHKTLKETISQAETHQKQVANIVDRAKEALVNVKNQYDGISRNKAKWFSSIRKVINQEAVEKTRELFLI